MYTNQYDQALDEVSITHGLNWTDESKIALLVDFLREKGASLLQFENFLKRRALEEIQDIHNEYHK